MEDHLLAVQFILIQSGGRAEQRVNAARTHTASRHAPGTHTPTHPAHVFHARARCRGGETNALLHRAEGPESAGNLSLSILKGVAAGFGSVFLSPSLHQQRLNTAWKGERSSAGAACRLVAPAPSRILSHRMKERQVTEDGSRAVVSEFRPPAAQIPAHSLDFSFFFVGIFPMMPRCVVWRQPQKMRGCRQPETRRMHPSVKHVCVCVCVVEGE